MLQLGEYWLNPSEIVSCEDSPDARPPCIRVWFYPRAQWISLQFDGEARDKLLAWFQANTPAPDTAREA